MKCVQFSVCGILLLIQLHQESYASEECDKHKNPPLIVDPSPVSGSVHIINHYIIGQSIISSPDSASALILIAKQSPSTSVFGLACSIIWLPNEELVACEMSNFYQLYKLI